MTTKPIIYTAGVVPYEGNTIWIQRRDGNDKNGELFAFWGGRVEKGENALEAAIREYKEELDCQLTQYEYIGLTVKEQDERVIYEHTFMTAAPTNYTIREGCPKGVIKVTIPKARELRMNPGDTIILDKIKQFLDKPRLTDNWQ